MEKELRNKFEEMDKIGATYEMTTVLMANVGLVTNDAEFAYYFIKAIVCNGMNIGLNTDIAKEFNNSVQSSSGDGALDKVLNKMSSKVGDIGRESILKITNSYLIMSLQTIIVYGDKNIIDKTADLIVTLYAPLREMLKHTGTISFRTYNIVAKVMCMIGNNICNDAAKAGKTDYSGVQKIIGGFIDDIMVPLKSYIKGFIGFMALGSIPSDVRKLVKETAKKLEDMRK